MERTTLEDEVDGRNSSHRWVTLHDDGRLEIAGQDLGAVVERFWGATEYEFARTVPPPGVARLRELLGLAPGDDLLAAVRASFSGPGASSRLEDYLKDNAIQSSLWSRVGD